ncbi:MAG: nitronate monooxygenase family protein [Candidatus Cloacimonadales bacterium]
MFPTLCIDDLSAKIPIIQGGMGVGISISGLASAVAEQGGIGVISSVALGLLKTGKEKLREENINCLVDEIRKAKAKTQGILGINVMVAAADFNEIVLAGLREKIDIIFMGAGLPTKLPPEISDKYLDKIKTKFAPIVSSARAAKLIFRSWERKYNRVPDAVVVEGPQAGGHLGFSLDQINDPAFSLEKLIPEICQTIAPFRAKYQRDIPVIAAGGIYSGADIAKFIDLGAAGVQMGTRFVATEECDADPKFKQQFINCQKSDIGLIKSPVGMPGRAIINQFLVDVKSGLKKPVYCPWQCLKSCKMENSNYCIADALVNAKNGILEQGFSFAGVNAYRVDKILSVKNLINSLEAEYDACRA